MGPAMAMAWFSMHVAAMVTWSCCKFVRFLYIFEISKFKFEFWIWGKEGKRIKKLGAQESQEGKKRKIRKEEASMYHGMPNGGPTAPRMPQVGPNHVLKSQKSFLLKNSKWRWGPWWKFSKQATMGRKIRKFLHNKESSKERLYKSLKISLFLSKTVLISFKLGG